MSHSEKASARRSRPWQRNIYKLIHKLLDKTFISCYIIGKGEYYEFRWQPLDSPVEKTNILKGILVDYVGEKESPDNDEVTIEMIINTLAEEFPEFLLAVAEENWIRGYHQALADVEVGQKLYEEEKNKVPDESDEE